MLVGRVLLIHGGGGRARTCVACANMLPQS